MKKESKYLIKWLTVLSIAITSMYLNAYIVSKHYYDWYWFPTFILLLIAMVILFIISAYLLAEYFLN